MNYKYLDKDAKKCMFVGTLFWTLFLFVVLGAGYYLGYDYFVNYLNLVNVVLIVLVVLLVINLFISPHFRYKRYKYLITNDKVDVVEGYIFIKRDIVPIERVHKITLERGPIENIYGLSKVVLTTAGGIVTIKFLKLKEAEVITENLKNLVNEMIV